jgi:hypothetical protein
MRWHLAAVAAATALAWCSPATAQSYTVAVTPGAFAAGSTVTVIGVACRGPVPVTLALVAGPSPHAGPSTSAAQVVQATVTTADGNGRFRTTITIGEDVVAGSYHVVISFPRPPDAPDDCEDPMTSETVTVLPAVATTTTATTVAGPVAPPALTPSASTPPLHDGPALARTGIDWQLALAGALLMVAGAGTLVVRRRLP